ncbi:Asp-tRNA(Asn)/Glu-tRNA(Gln) amidotransferase GatCAB subunit A [Aneurinibacillus migulanus]|uniref:Aspartyl-tRNA(Asn)/glutamyl-tRNA(Gln) amidotransferase subunit A n=1 Tax=Aneurinibacillus migulanus TaxID=47500 RepID=A0A0M0H1G8_ANEMI|nr:Asp-tRNA(Asn)/Glu-tRNA(Gln) amidotransferase GatCAB subunit A [Aneurinibacillus migulanus]KON95552.1 glutamyl-tRNA amidotransferase [Aneurinibacillus migulanus]MED0892062.1 Asp-tRNA(Asn)/Glu-tRNA(Gln) amidotransferase GatCAB subunit A [Aneurinibacillus migulanus]MED1618671.1 Asp-tRNA(Asn)/Glu-tRNA(Gln) amidotransferase GatCAB subunit A [Aneurinibacillus migulanus]SDJ08321.1 aspartyl-tRNA(Asn)/glutamyl-tRNA(Gln) amidotransferase subunit A [Aneurinibacillus migulanus]GED16862.1 glutamyl-tRNA(
MTDVLFKDIGAVHNDICTKRLSPVELTDTVLKHIEQLNPVLHAFIHVQHEQARERAVQLENEQMRGTIRGPLHGIPIAVKDIIHVKGTPTTAGSKILKDWQPDEDATVVRRLVEAGAIIVGKANLHEFAMGATNENPHYGSVRNPWDISKIAGGSSGGSAVAVATGMSFGALGTDTAGSVRLPSALCGTVGLKPTYGRVSRHGCLPFSWSFDHIGPMTRTVRDAAIMLDVLAGADPLDEASSQIPYKRDTTIFHNLTEITIGVCVEHFFEGVDSELASLMDEALLTLEELGATRVDLHIPGIEEALWAQRMIAQAEAYSFHEPLLNDFGHQYSPDVAFRLEFGRQISATDYLKAQRIRRSFIQRTLDVMKGVDVLVTPMNHNKAFPIGSVTPEESIANMFKLAKAPLVSLLGFPALALPCGYTQENMPVGMQLVGKPFAESLLLQVGDCYERFAGWPEHLLKCKLTTN